MFRDCCGAPDTTGLGILQQLRQTDHRISGDNVAEPQPGAGVWIVGKLRGHHEQPPLMPVAVCESSTQGGFAEVLAKVCVS
jgi:hypothetical protein